MKYYKGDLYKQAKRIKSKCKSTPDSYPFYTIHPKHLEWYIETIKGLEERVLLLKETIEEKESNSNKPESIVAITAIQGRRTIEQVNPVLREAFIQNNHRVPIGLYMNGWEMNILLEEEKKYHKDRE